jgi:integrase
MTEPLRAGQWVAIVAEQGMARRPELKAAKTESGWMVSIPPKMTASGKRERRFFGENENKAERFASSLRTKFNSGLRGSVLDAATALQAQEALKILAPLNVSLVEAARLVEAQAKATGSRETFRERWERYQSAHELNWREIYASEIAKIPQWVGEEFMEMRIYSITNESIESALMANGSKAKSTLKRRSTIIRAVISGKSKERRADKIEVMTAGQCGAMLRACEDAAERRAVALLLFAGIRPDVEFGEISRLDWACVGENEIYIAHDVSKTGTDRHIPITPRLCRLLRGHPKEGGVLPANWKRKCDRLRKAAGISGKSDITRHTFASHFLAAYGEKAAKSAMGHTAKSDTLFRHYRRAVTEAAGKKYFADHSAT